MFRSRLLVLIFATAAVTLTGCASGAPMREPEALVSIDQHAASNAEVFDTVSVLVERSYYSRTDAEWVRRREQLRPRALAATDTESLYSVLTVMLDHLNDAHAYVQSPIEVARDDEPDGARPLFGLRIRRRGESFIVDDVRPGGPADQAGVQAGWTIAMGDGRPYRVDRPRRAGVPEQLSFRDPEGAVRVLTVAPQPLSFGPRRRVARLPDGVWLIGFDDFDPGSADWLFGALAAVPPDAPIIVDLRDNGGGRIHEVERMLGCFLRPGSLIARMRPRAGQRRDSIARADCPRRVTGPLVVLIGRRSRSGAEMFAAAIQEWRRGELVGGRTAGALLSSLRYPLPDGGRLTLSEADFVTGGGRRVERVGVVPDVTAVTSQADRRVGRDPALAAAVRRLTRQDVSERLSAAASETTP